MKYVYLAGPYTKPTPNHNVFNAIHFADGLMAHGFIPFLPHLSHLWDTVSPHPYEYWMALDFAWVERCDVLFRMSGESSGADREVEHAKSKGIPVVYTMQELLNWRDNV